MSLDPELLAILVCPVTRTPLRYDEAAGELVSEAAGLAFQVRDGVPVMLVEEARRLTT
ncbi:Trm112 family protein [Sphingomonas sp. SRS2]|uniref:Trm112 family protein n=1 Tax=Sphingomonas sp. SRS2 TaxID=133190 RepID=UPI000A018320|nr:Trm112 family protein [Sphingomonas sp. SRS2]